MDRQATARRPLSPTERLRCVVVESGSSRLTEAGTEGFDETIAIAQMQGELPLAFAERAMNRIAGIERSGRRFESATVLAGNCHDPAAKAARRLVVLGLSAHARARGGMSELTLVTDHDTRRERQAELLSLVEEALVLPNADLVPVQLRFGKADGGARRPSGLIPVSKGRNLASRIDCIETPDEPAGIARRRS